MTNINYLAHHGIEGQKWGVRRYQNEDGSLTEEGRKRYGYNKNYSIEDARRDKADLTSYSGILKSESKSADRAATLRSVSTTLVGVGAIAAGVSPVIVVPTAAVIGLGNIALNIYGQVQARKIAELRSGGKEAINGALARLGQYKVDSAGYTKREVNALQTRYRSGKASAAAKYEYRRDNKHMLADERLRGKDNNTK